LRPGRIYVAETASRSVLEKALYLYAPLDRQGVARTYLAALSVDELLFLADFLGSCILITSTTEIDIWDAVSRCAQTYQSGMKKMTVKQRQKADHKLVLVSEFAACCGFLVKFQ
jgi:hypothetical protein